MLAALAAWRSRCAVSSPVQTPRLCALHATCGSVIDGSSAARLTVAILHCTSRKSIADTCPYSVRQRPL